MSIAIVHNILLITGYPREADHLRSSFHRTLSSGGSNDTVATPSHHPVAEAFPVSAFWPDIVPVPGAIDAAPLGTRKTVGCVYLTATVAVTWGAGRRRRTDITECPRPAARQRPSRIRRIFR
ncbi:MAG TPA: hypothetical protein VHK90_02660 [Thermoanaerobaculia bacterium]|nr:hypothetical protein [Thermoanaerobaculia bacterium]